MIAGGEDRLAIDAHRFGHSYVVALGGVLDWATCGLLAGELADAIEQDVERIVLDLGGLERIDDAGARVIVVAWLRAAGRRGELVIVPGPGSVQSVIDAVGCPFRCLTRVPVPAVSMSPAAMGVVPGSRPRGQGTADGRRNGGGGR